MLLKDVDVAPLGGTRDADADAGDADAGDADAAPLGLDAGGTGMSSNTAADKAVRASVYSEVVSAAVICVLTFPTICVIKLIILIAVGVLVEDFAEPGAGLGAAPSPALGAALEALELEALELEVLELRGLELGELALRALELEALKGVEGLFGGTAPVDGPPVDSGVGGGCKAASP